MSSATLDTYSESGTDQAIQYRAIYTGAIIGLVLGLLSVAVLFAAMSSFEASLIVAPIPILGIIVSLRSWARIKREPEQYTGSMAALGGFLLSLVFLVVGVGYGGFVYATEVPDGYKRLAFEDFRPSELQERGGVLIPPEVKALDGKRVFIKGYIRPGSAPVRTGIDRFLLVRDNNTCCFGDLSKVKWYDQVAVQITSSHRVDDTLQLLRMGGILELHPENFNLGQGYPIFTLRADYALQ